MTKGTIALIEPTQQAMAPFLPSTPHVGAFVLETLTLGMYGDPRHTLREYVQNSFDAIRAAQRTRFLTDRGRVTITIAEDEITILDNGLGVSGEQAWKTLTSVGASKKDRLRDAGFRGIGRLAGMAYCDELIFETTFPGETVCTEVRFDCAMLLKAMGPDEGGDVELAILLARAIRFSKEVDKRATDEHYFKVTLKGLKNAPEMLTDQYQVRAYLSETVPVEFDQDWSWRTRIEADYAAYFGSPIETIDVIVTSEGTSTQIRKPYGDVYEHRKGQMALRTIEFYPGDNNRYWGWVGRLSESAAVTDWRTRGLRIRVRNIQVDGTEIFEKIFTELKPSYGRFSAYYVGEIHIAADKVVPNARRDDFEETEEWIDIKNSLKETVCRQLASDAYDASQRGQIDTKKVVEEISKLEDRSHSLSESSRATYDQVVDLMNTAKRLRRRATSALKIVGDLDDTSTEDSDAHSMNSVTLEAAAKTVENVEVQARMLVGRFLGEDERLSALKARLRQEIVQEVLDVVNAFVDPTTYRKIRRQLIPTE